MDRQKYEAVRKAVIEAVPEITKEQELFDNFLDALYSLPCDPGEAFGELPPLGRPIRLADVLHALRAKGNYDTEATKYWEMLSDDLSLQSPETIDFLHSILVK